MEIKTSTNPAYEAGSYIAQIINEHSGDVFCFLSGGSALSVVEHLEINRDKSECRTIFCMGDERGSREAKINNFLQLQEMYPDHPISKLALETVPYEDESLENFSTRVSNQIEKIFSELENPLVIHVVGVGKDGHTAGIFPLDKESFQETYRADSTYVPVQVEGLTIDSRASLTPGWILNNVNHVVGYITGESKREILESLINESKELHERPAELLKIHNNTVVYTDLEIV